MIFGIGTDIVKISRIEDMKSLSRFTEKILSTEEHKLASSYKGEKLIKFLAKQFAGKEAISKAFGTGIREPILFKDIEILSCLLYTSPSPRDLSTSRMPSSA